MKSSKTWVYKLLLLFLFLVFAYTANRTILLYGNFRQQTEDIAQVLVRTIDQFGLEISRFEFHFSYNLASILGTGTIVGGIALGILYHSGMPKHTEYEYGSARWGNKKDIKPLMDKKKDNNIILTKSESLSMSGRMKITKSNNFNRNKNVIVVGGAGSGKTRFYVKPNLMQLHSSYVVSDSKGLLLSETATMFKEAGYEIKVFDLITRENTDFYNPFTYIRSEDDILKVVNNLIKNTSDPEKKGGDDFWEKAETALLMATFSYLLQEVDEEDQTLTNVVEMVRLANCPEDVPDYVSPLDVIFNELEEKDPANFAVAQYKIFKLAGDRTAKSILVSLGVRLSPFDIPNIKKIVSKDTLALDTVGDKKTIIYILLSDTDTSFNFLASMLYQQLFDSLVYKADNVYKGRLPHHVRCVLDEFANIGQIPDFEKVISVIRSREISVNVILQNISQLKNLYKDTWETIIGTSDVFLYLGGMELSTHEYISKLLGKKTIQHKNISITKGSNGNFSENYQKMGRNLLDVDEVANLSGTQAILKIRGIVPFISEKYDITKHKNYKKLGDVTPKNWYERNQSPKNEEENGLK
ncbi:MULTISPECIES: VirD4-like conjugal transfer protein, CD1115 family [unclassified Enterococcus]|uniref:VirD4-like conjugal transfer protein, CD1115 family n=1 Tax=unclassified Enterococcus TaxID=2608891 RepID=UPI001F5D7907|nr:MULTISPECIES: type IV secretory system conjugative DNA transfer family protein [unclassified Enterococcus]